MFNLYASIAALSGFLEFVFYILAIMALIRYLKNEKGNR